jgi:MFS transporter, DHA1 family, inner membrane transport protein
MIDNNYETKLAKRQLSVALLVGSIALLISGVQPILYGAMVNEQRLSLDTMGLIIMAEIVALGIGAGLAVKLPLTKFRQIVLAAGAIVVACNMLTILHVSLLILFAIRIGAGLAEGVLVWSTACVIVRTRIPERNSGMFSVGQVLVQAVFASVLTSQVMPHYSWRGGFIALAIAVLLCTSLGVVLPTRLGPVSEAQTGPFTWTRMMLLSLAIGFLQQAGLGAAWAYLEPLGQSVGMSDMQAESLISTVLCVEVAGGVAGTILARRLAPSVGVALGAAGTIVSAIGMLIAPKGAIAEFSTFAMIFGFFWPFVMPYNLGMALKADPSGKIGTLLPAAQVLGVAFGPLIAALLIDGSHVNMAIIVCLILTLGAVVCLAGSVITVRMLPGRAADPSRPAASSLK